MPDMSRHLAGAWIKANDLPEPKVFTVSLVEEGRFFNETKDEVALSFNETNQRLLINKTNIRAMAEMFSMFSEKWVGQQVELFATTTMFQGSLTPCVRLRAPSQAQQPQQGAGVQAAFGQQQQPPVQPNDGIPF